MGNFRSRSTIGQYTWHTGTHRVQSAGDMQFVWDDAGNLARKYSDTIDVRYTYSYPLSPCGILFCISANSPCVARSVFLLHCGAVKARRKNGSPRSAKNPARAPIITFPL